MMRILGERGCDGEVRCQVNKRGINDRGFMVQNKDYGRRTDEMGIEKEEGDGKIIENGTLS